MNSVFHSSPTCYSKTANPGVKQRGSVILLVLVLIAFLSLLTLIYLQRVEEHRKLNWYNEQTVETAVLLRGGLEVALASLDQWRQARGPWHSAREKWSQPIVYLELETELDPEEWPIVIRIEDAGDRVPFLQLNEEDLSFLLRNLFRRDSNVNEWIDRLLDWTDEDDFRRQKGAEYRDYGFASDDPLRLPPNQPIVNEWQWQFFLSNGLPPNMDAEALERLSRLFHFYPISGINLNSIDRVILEEMGTAFQFDTARILSMRDSRASLVAGTPVVLKDAVTYVPTERLPPGLHFTAQVEAFRITVSLSPPNQNQSATWIVLTKEPEEETSGSAYQAHPSGFFISQTQQSPQQSSLESDPLQSDQR